MLIELLKRVLRREPSSGWAAAQVAAPRRSRVQRLESALTAQANGATARAEALYLELIDDDTDDAQALHLLGHLYVTQKRYAEASRVLMRAAALEPETPEILFETGLAYAGLQDFDRAVRAYEHTLRMNPDFAPALNNLANVHKTIHDWDGAERCYRRLLELDPTLAGARAELGITLLALGRHDEAIASFHTALEIDPTFGAANSYLLYALNFHGGYAASRIFEAHVRWAQRFADPLPAMAPATAPTPRKLRIGYVSPNFYDHPVTYFFEPALKHHDFETFDVICYSDVERPDAYTARLQRYGSWRNTRDLDDEQLAELVRDDQVDILVDLSGHTKHNRLLAFARKPAPVQITWNGYANTTGMRAMDYRITDAFADPPGSTDHLHTEKLLRLPGIFMAFEPPPASPPLTMRAAQDETPVTFVSCNAISKITPQVIAVWARILQAVPGSRLALYTVPEGSARTRLTAAFESLGIAARRLELHRRLPLQQFLCAIATGDIALDPFPFVGTTTTCYTLWMGLPLITLAGATHVSRVGVSFLSNAGLEELIAVDEDDYVRRAVALAHDPVRLAALRGGMRKRMLESAITDGARLTRHLETAYLNVWNEYRGRNAS